MNKRVVIQKLQVNTEQCDGISYFAFLSLLNVFENTIIFCFTTNNSAIQEALNN